MQGDPVWMKELLVVHIAAGFVIVCAGAGGAGDGQGW